jgi:hypothetical protein
VEPFDTTRPNVARVWDYWLGGKDNFAADRELAEKMLAVHPVTAQMARENRQFLGRAVSYVAARGVRQFIDIAGVFAQALVPGSYLIISVGSGDPSEGENFTSAYTAARIYIHSRKEIQGFFGGLELVPPGVVSVRDWSGDGPALNLEPLTATFVAGVARKAHAG